MNDGAALQRILDPNGLYWAYPGEAEDDVRRARPIELRVDVPAEEIAAAAAVLTSEGWTLASRPDPESKLLERLYFCKVQSLEPTARTSMLTAGYNAAVAAHGRFWSWINLDDESAE